MGKELDVIFHGREVKVQLTTFQVNQASLEGLSSATYAKCYLQWLYEGGERRNFQRIMDEHTSINFEKDPNAPDVASY